MIFLWSMKISATFCPWPHFEPSDGIVDEVSLPIRSNEGTKVKL